jgi:UDP-N-acetyl-2-amino-2-deoxyglucuronate dehydrogenase
MKKKLNFAIIGTGNIAKVHAAALTAISNAELTAVFSRSGDGKNIIPPNSPAKCTNNLPEILEDPDIDVISICTPSGEHHKVALLAAQKRKHLLIEKPLEITLQHVDQIIAACIISGVKLAGVFHSRFRPGVQKTAEALQAGRLGQINLILGSVKWYRPETYYRGTWRGTLALDGGGALMNQSIHTVDLVQWFGGPVRSVYGRIATRIHQIEAEDTGSAILEFENGAQGVIQGATSCWPGDPARIEIHGERGTIILEEGRIIKWKLQDATEAEKERMLTLDSITAGGAQDPMGISSEFHRLQIIDLIAAIQENRKPLIDGSEARKAVEIILAIYQSAKKNKPVKLPLK